VWLSGKIVSVHLLVLEAFVGPRPPGLEGCHANDIKADNRLVNLRWDTRKSNTRDKVRNDRIARGERNAWAKLTEAKIREIR
jgi:hypothetical protein